MIRGLVLDFDGLIIDTEVPVYQGWVEVYERYGQHLSPELWSTVIGRGAGHFDALAELERRLGRRLDREAIRAGRGRRVTELVAALQVLPGVLEWREQAMAMGVRLGVASSSSRSWVVGHLVRLGLDGWDCVRCGDDVERAKPAPDVYLAVVECLGLRPAEVIAVEDSATGLRAAKAAGLYCVAVPSTLTAGQDFGEADLLVRSLTEAPFREVAARAVSAST